jgi:hypothetical protein
MDSSEVENILPKKTSYMYIVIGFILFCCCCCCLPGIIFMLNKKNDDNMINKMPPNAYQNPPNAYQNPPSEYQNPINVAMSQVADNNV